MDGPADEAWMKAVAREMNLSETAFLHPEGEGTTPPGACAGSHRMVEVDLCGHATLASAHVLWQTGRLAPEAEARFLSRSGPLGAPPPGRAHRAGFPDPDAGAGRPAARAGPGRWARLPSASPAAAPTLPGRAGVAPPTVRDLRPDMTALAALDTRCVMVTAPGDRTRDRLRVPVLRARASASPRIRSPAPPTTLLGPFWGARLGKQQLVGYQASARGGTVYLQLRGDRVRPRRPRRHRQRGRDPRSGLRT